MPRSVRTVTRIDADGAATTVYRKNKKKRKKRQSVPLGPVATLARRGAEGARAAASSYLSSHDASNRDERDGWLVQLGPNVFKASTKGLRRIARGDGG